MLSYLATAMLAMGVLASESAPLEWQSDYGKALAETRADNQPLLVVLDEPGSAEARVEPAMLGDGKASERKFRLLRRYHRCHVDVTTPYGKKVAEAFKVRKFPHMAIIDKTGSSVLFARSGKMDEAEWDATLEKYQDGTKPTPSRRVSYKIGGGSSESSQPISNPRYCPSCQRRSM